ncbi:MAG: T9SS type A sorting domain-containing protein [Paludibacter sp.]|nr:T9SS type A sorting domain-containing protein [Paludibacter sp.]
MAESGVYVGGHIRRERPGTITKLKESGFTYVILFNINVESDGTLTTDGETICSNGQYVFGNTQPYYVSDITSLKTTPTNINRIEVCIGGWGNTSYTNIKNIIASQGTGSSSILYRNFQALKNAISVIDAVNNDDEYTYDVNSSAAFHVMLSDLGYKTTLAPYTNKTYWQNLATSVNNLRSGAVDRILLQCYDGGAGNNPSDWHINGIPLHAGRQNYDDFGESKTLMQNWKDNAGVVGGFFWVYNDETWSLNTYATAVNRIFGAKTTNAAVATFCSDINYGGYSIGLPAGAFTTADLAAYGITNDDISSFRVNSGYKVTVYTDNSFGGTTTSYTSDISNVGSTYNDQISSIRIYKNASNPVATFYPDVNYGGFAVGLPQGTFTVDELAAYGIKNDDITSLKVNSGYRVVLYTDNNFSGTSVTYTSDQSWVGDYNDKISSIKIYKYAADAVANFYNADNSQGDFVGLPLGTFTLSALKEYGINDNSITSFDLTAGYRVVLYSDDNFSGSSASYTSGQGWLGDLNDKTSSIKIYKYAADAVANFYNADNSQGDFVGLPLGTFTLSALKEYGINDNSITSFDLTAGYRVVLYSDDNFSGSSASYTSGQGWLGDLNDKTSSIKIYKYAADAVANFYNADNSQGDFVGLPLGTFTLSALKEYGINDNSITSFDLTAGYRVVLYSDDNFSGSSASYTSGQGWLGDLNDKTSSIKIYKYAADAVANFYNADNSQGDFVGLPLGTFTLSALKEYGINDNSITSFDLTAGYRVVLYSDDNFSGSSASYTSGQGWLGDLNDKTSSIKIYRYSSNAITTFYSDINYGGLSVGLPLGTYTTAELASYGIQNDDITSLKVNSGYKVIVYMDNNFSGTSVSYTSDQSNVGTTYNDKISSVQMYKYSADAVASFYDSDNSQGTSTGLPTGLFTSAEMNKYGIADNSITSFDLQSGYQITIYADDNFSGSSASYTAGQGWLYDLNDATSSIKIYPVFGSDITDNGGVATASHTSVSSSETIGELIDNSALTKYCANASAGAEVWMQYQSPGAVILQSYTLTSANDFQSRDPKTWTLQASNNGTDWTVIDTQTDQIFATRYLKKTFAVSTANAYKFFRLLVTERYDSSSTVFQLAELQLFGDEQDATESSAGVYTEEVTITGMNQMNLPDLKIYPNPVVNFIKVDMPAETSVLNYIVYNALGVSVTNGKLNNGEKIDVQSLTPGIYQLVLTVNRQRMVRQFLKKQ